MHLRRALLLFAIVLGLAAIAATVSRPREENEPAPPRDAPEPTLSAQPDAPSDRVELFFDAAAPRTQRMRAGEAGTVYVAVAQPGQVEVADLGLSSPAEPLTAARFDVLPSRGGRFPITFVQAGGSEPQDAGTLVVRE